VQAILAGLPRQDAILLVRSLLGSINTDVGGGREPEEIVDRLLERLRAGDQRGKAERAIAFILELSQLAGPRDLALQQAEELISRYGLSPEPLQELERICRVLDSMQFDWSNVTIDLSLGRGLQYYTGLVFEVYGQGLGSEDQLCGGGRYDGLARALGSKQTIAALGCSWGLERLRLLAEAPTAGEAWLDAVVVPSAATFGYATEVAQALRGRGLRVELELRERNLRASIAYASRRKARWLLVAGEQEVAARSVRVRHLETASEQAVTLEALRAEGLTTP
ncbi:MAG TPA: ATP phosphoribosyltransferase regulatory subunit, partial [Chloroflexota bacterium]